MGPMVSAPPNRNDAGCPVWAAEEQKNEKAEDLTRQKHLQEANESKIRTGIFMGLVLQVLDN